MIAIFLLLVVTDFEIWKGVLIGITAAICLILFRNDLRVLLLWKHAYEWPNNALRLTLDLFYIWVFFQIAGLPLAGGCIEAIRKRYTTLGVRSSLAAFIYYFALVLGFMWIVCDQYWR